MAVAFALALALLAVPSRANAWVEMHVARDDVRVTVAPDGQAKVEHKVLLLVSGGPLKSFTIRGVDSDAMLEDGAYVIREKDDLASSLENAVPLRVERVADAASGSADLAVVIDGGRGISRGRYLAVVRYRTQLASSGAIRVEGSSARLDWTGPRWDDGLDTTRAWFVFPAAPLEPKTIEPSDDDDSAGQGTFLSTLARRPEGDVLEVVRPYASRGERVLWSIRFDARALTIAGSRAQPGSDHLARDDHGGAGRPSLVRLVRDARDTAFIIGALALFLLVTSLVAAHAIEVRQRAAARGQQARPLIPVAIAVRAIAAGLMFVAGLWLELHEPKSLPGALLVASSVIWIWHRTARARPALRGPGTWLCVRVDEAFAMSRPPRRVFDPSTWPGALMMLVIVVGFAAAGRLVAEKSLYHGVLVALDVVPLLALFFTGRASSLVPDLTVDTIPLLSKVVRRVEARGGSCRVVPRVRVPQGEPDTDELRIVFLPRDPVRGLRAIELATAYALGPGGHVLLPEILVRFQEGSPCQPIVERLEPYGRAQRGRNLDERVVAFLPKLPTLAMTSELVLALLEHTSAPAPHKKRSLAAGRPRPEQVAQLRDAARTGDPGFVISR